ncbi:MAG: S8 family serine peptidase [Muribaculaceae bacterium]|nr:S8 family serine peptidase [Muribaculaceae bacterium]
MKRFITGLLSVAIICASAWADAHLSPQSAILLKRQQSAVSRADDGLVSAYLHVSRADFSAADFEQLGGKISLDLGNILTARFPLSALQEVAKLKGVTYIEVSSPVQPMMDIARDETGGSKVIAGEGFKQPYTGKGVIVGVVDCGFDYTHGAFADSEGKLRISRVWEQSTTPVGDQKSPEAFGYGVELTSPEEILASGGDIRSNSHGTHVASIAAGSDSRLDGILCGMAPNAEIVLVSMTDNGVNNVAISDAVAYIFAYAEQAGKPCVVNLSLGNHAGPHDGTSTFDLIADKMQGPGRLIVGSSGNHQGNLFHVSKTFTQSDLTPLKVCADFKTSKYEGDIEIWSSADVKVYLKAIKLSTAEITDEVCVFPSEQTSVKVSANIAGEVNISSETNPANNKQHVFLSSSITSIRNGYALVVEVIPNTAGSVDIWADNINVGLSDKELEGFASPADATTICEIGGTANRILTVGAYVTRADYTVLGETTPRHLNETVGDIGSFSSCGPTADGRTKPQVTAPGCFISAAVSDYDNSGTIILSRYFEDTEDMYGYMQGTSMSAPHVAGIVATWLEAYPQLTPELLAEVVMTTSRTDAYAKDIPAEGSSVWGWGKIDAVKGLEKCIKYAEEGAIQNIDADSSVNNTDEAVYNLCGIRVAPDSKNIDNLLPGIYIIKGKKLIIGR